MKSRISIEIDFDNGNQPVIQILSRTSDDVRDSLVQAFLQSLAHTSRWCTIEYKGSNDLLDEGQSDFTYTSKWAIKPMTLEEIPSELKLMQATLKK